MEDMLLKIGIKAGHLITGLIAGLMGLLFNKKPQNFRQKVKSYLIVVSGAIATGFITPLILVKWDWLMDAEYSVAFVVGLFGMGIIESLFVLVSKIQQDPISIGKAIRNIWKGDN